MEELDVVWRPFELRPEPAPMPAAEYLDRVWRQVVAPRAQAMGVEMIRPTVHPRTRLAHEATALAQRQGRMGVMADALLRAYFQHDRDIGEIGVLCEIGGSVGLDPVALRDCLERRTLQAAVAEELALSREYGITAVPTFIVGGRHVLQGLVSTEQLLQAVQKSRANG